MGPGMDPGMDPGRGHDYVVRAVRAEEWPRVKELRLAALRDPAAPVAFLETYEQAVAEPDAHWRARAAGNSHATRARQAFYRRFGFVRGAGVVRLPGDPPAEEYEMVLDKP